MSCASPARRRSTSPSARRSWQACARRSSHYFCGIETPDPVALKAMHKDHNMMVPIMEAIQTLNSFGMEVVSGIILGLDTDKPETGDASARIHRGVANSAVDHQPVAGAAEDAAVGSLEAREPADRGRRPRFQCRFPLPYEDVVMTWRACMGSRLSACQAAGALRISDPRNLSEPDQAPRTPQQKHHGRISSSA